MGLKYAIEKVEQAFFSLILRRLVFTKKGIHT